MHGWRVNNDVRINSGGATRHNAFAKALVQRVVNLLRRHDPTSFPAALHFLTADRLPRLGPHSPRARPRDDDALFLGEVLNGLASSSGGTSAIGSAASPFVAASTATAATTGSGAGSSSVSGAAAVWPVLATGGPALARMARERARETITRSSLGEVFEWFGE